MWLVPSFESDRYGRPEFAQLRRTCPVQIRTGAEDGSEMGAFCVLKQPQRESNLRLRLDEYLPVGLEAGLIYVDLTRGASHGRRLHQALLSTRSTASAASTSSRGG